MMTKETEPTRERILAAAIEVFASKGYHNARMDDIVDVSQTSKGSLYFHFPGKEQLFLALIDRFANLLEEKMTSAIASQHGGVRRIDAALVSGLDISSQYRLLAKIFIVQASGLGQKFEEKRTKWLDHFARLIQQYLDDAVADGDILLIDTEIIAHIWIGAINELVMRWILSGEPKPDRFLPVLREALLRTIGLNE